MSRDRFYDPQIGDSEPMQIRGFQVAIGGTYVLMDDVVTALRGYAQSLDDPDAGALIHEVASWLQAGSDGSSLASSEVEPEGVEDQIRGLEARPSQAVKKPAYELPYGSESLDKSLDIERVEIYPDPPEDPRPKWYARSIDTGGFIVQTTGGSFDQAWVIQNASERWPGKDVHLLRNAGEDSKWIEDGTRGVFPSKGPPVRRLWAGAGR